MNTSTDNVNEIGLHVFERAGLGKAPFHFVGFHIAKYQACPGAPIQAGSSCDYCGQGIMYVCAIQDANGRRFKVGCDCVVKTGDAGLLKAYKRSPEYRASQRAKATEKDARVREEIAHLLAEHKDKLAAIKREKWNGMEESVLDFLNRSLSLCGASGRARNLRWIKTIISK